MGVVNMWTRLTGRPSTMVQPEDALPGRDHPSYRTSTANEVLGTPLLGPWPDGTKVIYLAMGCFWGAERKFWQLPGVVGTAVGYMGGFTPNPTYEEVCSGRTGHTEIVMVAYDPERIDTYSILRTFWENHDPTQVYRQGNDVGTQYRSAAYTTDAEQHRLAAATRDAYEQALLADGFDAISTEIGEAEGREFYPAEDYHQQYLAKNPRGYDCASSTGLLLPPVALA
jgi:peptide-methionine (S)-S-oxide reductase